MAAIFPLEDERPGPAALSLDNIQGLRISVCRGGATSFNRILTILMMKREAPWHVAAPQQGQQREGEDRVDRTATDE